MKKISAIIITVLLLISCSACVNDTDIPDNNNNGNNADFTVTKNYSGEINFCAPLQDQYQAYVKLIQEYNKFQPDVTVKLTSESEETYSSILLNDILQPYSSNSVNIFAGNYVNNYLADVAIDLYSYILRPNQYYKGSRWKDCLDVSAYVTSGTANTCKLLATNIISVTWYYNKNVIENQNINIENMKTWNDFINVCSDLKDAGYTAPIGVSTASHSYRGGQLSWLLRIYGDQYYRELYPYIQSYLNDYNYDSEIDDFVYNPSDPQPEDSENWNLNLLRMQQTILDKNSEHYSGPTSSRFKELFNNLLMLSPYVQDDIVMTSEELRGKFIAGGKGAPVFYMDVLGFGSNFSNLIKESENPFELGTFDFLPMDSKITNNKVLRSLGGNSGWLSVRETRDKKTNEMCIDFVKFFMSPYGQTVFIKALQDTGATLSGPTTVLNADYPDQWKSVYESIETSQNGLCDRNQYLTFMIIPFEVFTNKWLDIYNSIVDCIQANGLTSDTFFNNYYNATYTELERINQNNGFVRNEAWKNPSISPY